MRQFRNPITLVFTMAAIFILFPFAAMAQEAAAVVGGVDIGAFLNDVIIPFVSAALLGVASLATAWVARKLKLSGDSEMRAYLMNYIEQGVAYGESKAREMTSGGKLTVSSKNTAIDLGINFVLGQAPKAISRLGFAPEDLRRLIEAKMPTAEQ